MTETSENSTTADPRSALRMAEARAALPVGLDVLERLLKDLAELVLGESPNDGHNARSHKRDQDPARNVTSVTTELWFDSRMQGHCLRTDLRHCFLARGVRMGWVKWDEETLWDRLTQRDKPRKECKEDGLRPLALERQLGAGL
jgi:hypothetical protein